MGNQLKGLLAEGVYLAGICETAGIRFNRRNDQDFWQKSLSKRRLFQKRLSHKSHYFKKVEKSGRSGRAGCTKRMHEKTDACSNASHNYEDTSTVPCKTKRILITGKGSYIGESVKAYLESCSDMYDVSCISTVGLEPEPEIFKGCDVVFHAAGIAHQKETNENRALYYEINRDLTVKTAQAAKEAGAGQFIFLSSMSVYGKVTGEIKKSDVPYPDSAYGESKLSADEALERMNCQNFKVAVIRPPMVYGKGCRGNYQALRSFALKSPVFPDFKNRRSMIYIGNLCEFVKRIIDREAYGLFFAQNKEYTVTTQMVKKVAAKNGHKIWTTPVFNPILRFLPFHAVKKIFGSLTYEYTDVVGRFSFDESIELSEK